MVRKQFVKKLIWDNSTSNYTNEDIEKAVNDSKRLIQGTENEFEVLGSTNRRIIVVKIEKIRECDNVYRIRGIPQEANDDEKEIYKQGYDPNGNWKRAKDIFGYEIRFEVIGRRTNDC
jgi:hypothetical protein